MQKTTFELESGPKNANKDSKLNRVKNRNDSFLLKEWLMSDQLNHVLSRGLFRCHAIIPWAFLDRGTENICPNN